MERGPEPSWVPSVTCPLLSGGGEGFLTHLQDLHGSTLPGKGRWRPGWWVAVLHAALAWVGAEAGEAQKGLSWLPHVLPQCIRVPYTCLPRPLPRLRGFFLKSESVHFVFRRLRRGDLAPL